jgi:hypothetical protein
MLGPDTAGGGAAFIVYFLKSSSLKEGNSLQRFRSRTEQSLNLTTTGFCACCANRLHIDLS